MVAATNRSLSGYGRLLTVTLCAALLVAGLVSTGSAATTRGGAGDPVTTAPVISSDSRTLGTQSPTASNNTGIHGSDSGSTNGPDTYRRVGSRLTLQVDSGSTSNATMGADSGSSASDVSAGTIDVHQQASASNDLQRPTAEPTITATQTPSDRTPTSSSTDELNRPAVTARTIGPEFTAVVAMVALLTLAVRLQRAVGRD